MVPAQIEVEPAYRHRQCRVRAHSNEKKSRVLKMRPRVRGEEDGEASNGNGNREQGEKKAVFEPVRKERHDEGEDEGAGPGRDAVQLGADLRVAVRADDAGGEEGVAVGRHDEAEVHEAAQDEFEIFEAVEDVCGRDAAVARGAALVLFEPGSDVGALVFLEPVGFVSFSFVYRFGRR